MEVKLHIPDDIAKRLSAAGADLSRRALAREGYGEQALTLDQVSEMLGHSRVETEDFLGRHHVPRAVIEEADLDREAAFFEAASRRKLVNYSRDESGLQHHSTPVFDRPLNKNISSGNCLRRFLSPSLFTRS